MPGGDAGAASIEGRNVVQFCTVVGVALQHCCACIVAHSRGCHFFERWKFRFNECVANCFVACEKDHRLSGGVNDGGASMAINKMGVRKMLG